MIYLMFLVLNGFEIAWLWFDEEIFFRSITMLSLYGMFLVLNGFEFAWLWLDEENFIRSTDKQ